MEEKMNFKKLPDTLQQSTSQRIIGAIVSIFPIREVHEKALRIILFAIEEGLGCKDTATAISLTIAESTDISHDMFLVIKDLTGNPYFHPTSEISSLIEDYFEQVGDKFDSPEDIELYGELITDLDSPSQLEEDLSHRTI